VDRRPLRLRQVQATIGAAVKWTPYDILIVTFANVIGVYFGYLTGKHRWPRWVFWTVLMALYVGWMYLFFVVHKGLRIL
jgi:hypothetical protein